MLRILDRYVIREVLAPFGLALSLFTFILLVDPLMKEAQRLIEKGVGAVTILRILATLLPQALGITIPVALLVGLLIGLGRLSADREAVALQACGVSLTRLLRPVAACAVAACLATGYVMIWAMPAGNQHYQSLLAEIVAARIATEIKPRVFFEDFPNLTFYSRDVASDGAGWRDVFVSDRRNPDRPQFLVAARGRLVIDEKARSVDLTLWDGSSHRADPKDPAKYEVQRFATQTVKLNANDVFPKTEVMHGAPEMTISELQAEIAKKRALNVSPHNEVMYLHQKFAFPAACLVFGLLALSLGVSNSKDSKHASFVVGLAVVFVFYTLMMIGSSLTKAHVFPASLARWLPNIVLGLAGVALLIYRHRHADAGVQIGLPSMAAIRDAIERRLPWRRRASPAVEASAAAAREAQRPGPRARRPSQAKAPAGEGRPAGESGPGPSRPPERRRSGAAPPSDPARRLRRQGLSPGAAARLRRPARDLLHRLVHRLVRQSLQGPGHDVPAGAVHVVLDAAVRLLRAAAVGPGRHPRHHRAPHQVQRADHHARLRRQPVSHGAAPAGARPAVERPAVRPRGVVPRRLEPQGGGAEAPDARRRAAHVRRPGAPMGGRPRRTDLPLHLLRSAGEDADRPRGLPVQREAVGPGRVDVGPVRLLQGRGQHLARRPGLGRGASPTTWSPRTRRSRTSR